MDKKEYNKIVTDFYSMAFLHDPDRADTLTNKFLNNLNNSLAKNYLNKLKSRCPTLADSLEQYPYQFWNSQSAQDMVMDILNKAANIVFNQPETSQVSETQLPDNKWVRELVNVAQVALEKNYGKIVHVLSDTLMYAVTSDNADNQKIAKDLIEIIQKESPTWACSEDMHDYFNTSDKNMQKAHVTSDDLSLSQLKTSQYKR